MNQQQSHNHLVKFLTTTQSEVIMINEKIYHQIYHMYKEDEMSIRLISKKLNLDKKTVKKWIDNGHFAISKRTSKPSVLDPFKEMIKGLLERADYSSVQILQIIKGDGYKEKLQLFVILLEL